MKTDYYATGRAVGSLADFSIDTIQRMCKVRDAYSAGILTQYQACRWAFRLTCHMPYNTADPQDRIAYLFITSGGHSA
jgi:hypothetical protein